MSRDRTELRAVSFDVTRTLIHAPRLGDIYSEVLLRHGIEVASAEVERLVPVVWQELACSVPSGADRFAFYSHGARGFWRRFIERLCELLEVATPSPFAAAELFDRFGRAEAWEIYPDVLPCLSELSACGLQLAITSNWDERLPDLLERLGLLPFFDVLVYSAAVGREKPDAAIFHETLRRLELAPADMLHVGDRRQEDVEGAIACGIAALHLDRHLDHQGEVGEIASLSEVSARMASASAPPARRTRR